MKDVKKLIKLLEKVSGKKVKLEEGTWSVPNTLSKVKMLEKLLKTLENSPNVVDVDQVTNLLYHILGNDSLFDDLSRLGEEKAKGPEVAKVIKKSIKNLLADYNNPEIVFSKKIPHDVIKTLNKLVYVPVVLKKESEEGALPSNKQIGDIVNLDFGSAGELSGCRIKDVRFAEDKVYYDVEVPIIMEDDKIQEATIIKDVDSAIISEEVKEK